MTNTAAQGPKRGLSTPIKVALIGFAGMILAPVVAWSLGCFNSGPVWVGKLNPKELSQAITEAHEIAERARTEYTRSKVEFIKALDNSNDMKAQSAHRAQGTTAFSRAEKSMAGSLQKMSHTLGAIEAAFEEDPEG